MALTISSPGVQINEKDLSLRANLPTGTSVVVPGFAPQGPSTEPLLITSVSELESIYGTPVTSAERYFYYTCREVLNSPATLTTIRLPYGADSGNGFANAYSGLFYPAVSSGVGTPLSGTGALSATIVGYSDVQWELGAPTVQTLSVSAYEAIQKGNFTWVATSALTSTVGFSAVGAQNQVTAGLIVLNDLQTSINELGEGYYVGFASNLGLSGDSVNYNSVTKINTLSANGVQTTLATASDASTSRLDFQLSATDIDSDRGVLSVSEGLQKAGFYDFGTNEYSDHASLGVFKVRRSTVDANLLSIINVEKFTGSLDSTRLQTSPTGGTLANAFLEETVNTGSSTIKAYINPSVSTAKWYNTSTGSRAQLSVNSSAKALFPLGTYVPVVADLDTTKVIGDVTKKLDKALRTIESTENTTVDVIVDAGLSTIYSTTQVLGVSSFETNGKLFVSDVSALNQYWTAVANQLVNFAQNTRKDCVAIVDPSRQIFVSGNDSKVIDQSDSTFTTIFNNLKTQIGQSSSNYAAAYANWVKVNDVFTNRNVWVPFSGYAAAVFARNDQVAQPWSAPGGLNRGTFTAIDIALNPNQKQRDRLYEIAANPVVFFNGDGYAIYGQKTLQTKPTAFDRINVRRLFLSLERSVQRSLKYFVFEPNTDFTRTRLKNTITPVFDFAKNTEGLYDYLIVVDQRNNTPDIIDQNQLIVDIYLKPVRTAEFILVNFIATRTGQNFQELI
jgi:hypothetical protein